MLYKSLSRILGVKSLATVVAILALVQSLAFGQQRPTIDGPPNDQAQDFAPDSLFDHTEMYLLMGVPGANYQSGAQDSHGEDITSHSMNAGDYPTYSWGVQKNFNSHWCADVFYLNEGHIPNNHADGVGVTGCAKFRLGDSDRSVILQIGAGPYYRMNTTRGSDQIQIDQHELGTLAMLVLEKRLGSQGLKIRAELDQSYMFTPSVNGNRPFDGTSLNVGFVKEFDDVAHMTESDFEGIPAKYSFILGTSQINGADENMGHAFQIKRTTMLDNSRTGFSASESILREGDIGVANRVGVAAQVGYEAVGPSGIEAGAEVGPYVNHDLTKGKTKVDALFTMHFGKCFRNQRDICVFAQWSRDIAAKNDLATPGSRNGSSKAGDADIFGVGVSYRPGKNDN